jgi:hypothetical protein
MDIKSILMATSKGSGGSGKMEILQTVPSNNNVVIKLSGGVLYGLENAGKIRAYDISNPSNIQLMDELTPSATVNDCRDLSISGNSLYYTSHSNDYVFNVDISNPSNMVERGYWTSTDTNGADAIIAHSNGYVYLNANFYDNYITQLTPSATGFSDRVNFYNSTMFSSIGSFVEYGDYIFGISDAGQDTLFSLDVSDAVNQNLTVADSVTALNPTAITIYGDILYMTLADDSLVLYDISNPSNMQLIGTMSLTTYTTNPRAIIASENYLFVGDVSSKDILSFRRADTISGIEFLDRLDIDSNFVTKSLAFDEETQTLFYTYATIDALISIKVT